MTYPRLKAYAEFLLDNHLHDFVIESIKLSREVDIPVLKLFKDLSEEQFYQFVRKNNEDYLKSFSEGRALEETILRSQKWKTGNMHEVGKDELVIKDITLAHSLRKRALIQFLKKYTRDLDLYTEIIQEIELLYEEIYSISFNAFLYVQQEKLLEEKQLIDTVLNASLHSIIALKALRDEKEKITDFEYVFINNTAEQMLGASEESFAGKKLKELFPGVELVLPGMENSIFSEYVKTVETGKNFDLEFFYEPDGYRRWLRQAGSKWKDGLVISTADITTLKETEQELRNAYHALKKSNEELSKKEEALRQINVDLEQKVRERTEKLIEEEKKFQRALLKNNIELQKSNQDLKKINNDLDNFIYTASHDLKAPVSNIEGLIYSLSSSMENCASEEVEQIIQMMNQSVQRFQGTIRDLTEISKVQKNLQDEISEVNIDHLTEDVMISIKNLIDSAGANIETDFIACPHIRFSKNNLRSILYNLITNAVKYRSPERKPEIKLSCTKTDRHYILEVQDNGLGLKDTQKDKIFQMFKRLHDHVEGTGVGLYIVKRIIDNAGGKIEVESKEGEGTVFRVYFRKEPIVG